MDRKMDEEKFFLGQSKEFWWKILDDELERSRIKEKENK